MATIAKELAAFACRTKYEDIPADVLERGKSALLHGICVGACCYHTPNAILIKSALRQFGETDKSATMLFDGYKTSVLNVASANAVMFHARIQEDTHGITHPGPVLIPLAIALSEKYGRTGKELLSDLIVGYEIAAAVGMHTTQKSNAKGFRATPIYGIIAAAAVAGRILQLDEEEMRAALTYSCAFANGLVGRTTVSDEWMYEAAVAVRSAVLSCFLAKNGVKSDAAYFEIAKGYYDAFAEVPQDIGIITSHLGKEWEMRKVMFKFFPSGVINQAHILNFVETVQKHEIDPTEIEAVTIRMNKAESQYPGPTSRGPFNDYTQSALSIPFVCANVLLKKRFTYEDQLEFDNPEILHLMDKVEIIGDENYKPNQSEIVIRMRDGSEIREEQKLSAEYFNCDYETEIKLVRGLQKEMVMTPGQLECLIAVIRNMENQPNMNGLISATVLAKEEPKAV